MRKLNLAVLFIALLSGCTGPEADQPRSSEYLLHRAGYEPVRGKVVITDLGPGQLKVEINLENTDERYDFPAHLHFGSINEVGELAFRLEDVNGATGTSITILDNVSYSNGNIMTFEDLTQMDGSIKIHLPGDLFGHIVLSYGNIGKNENYVSDGITVCTGH